MFTIALKSVAFCVEIRFASSESCEPFLVRNLSQLLYECLCFFTGDSDKVMIIFVQRVIRLEQLSVPTITV